jgi:sulfite reductase (NADPH) hemoprotein beta-component
MVGHVMREFLPWPHLLTYLEAILRVYNRYGRRDNIHKARIKILVKERGPEKFRDEIEAEWAHLKNGPATLAEADVQNIEQRFTRPTYEIGTDPISTEMGSVPISAPGFGAGSKETSIPTKCRRMRRSPCR